MKKLKKIMKGFKVRTLGNYRIVKELAHGFDKNLNEYFYYIYTIEKDRGF